MKTEAHVYVYKTKFYSNVLDLNDLSINHFGSIFKPAYTSEQVDVLETLLLQYNLTIFYTQPHNNI